MVHHAIVPHGAPKQYRVDVEAIKIDAAKQRPKVTFVISNKNTNPVCGDWEGMKAQRYVGSYATSATLVGSHK